MAPGNLAAAARELDGGEYEAELASLYAAYCERRDGAGRDDAHSAAAAVASSLRERPDAWGARPVLVYGFDDLTEEQLDLLSAVGAAAEVTVAVNYEDNDALAARAGLLARLTDELAADTVEQLPFDPTYTASATLRELDRGLFEVTESRVEPDGGLALLECGGERGEAEAVAGEIATLLARGVAPDDVVVVLRRPEARGALYDQVLGGLRVPVAVEASVPLTHTAVGTGRRRARPVLIARCQGGRPAWSSSGRGPGTSPSRSRTASSVRARREAIRTATEAMEGWKGSQRDVARIREARRARGVAARARGGRPPRSPRIRTPARSPWISAGTGRAGRSRSSRWRSARRRPPPRPSRSWRTWRGFRGAIPRRRPRRSRRSRTCACRCGAGPPMAA